ncbi:MAG TPA: methyltransferase domain-containing protein [Geobacteraceae bacterium]
MSIAYEHDKNIHTLEGARTALPIILEGMNPASLLDVGCGIGTWLNAATEFGIADFLGLDGVAISPEKLLIPYDRFKCQDLTTSWSLNRRFDVVICFEVAEHLDEKSSKHLIQSIVAHSDNVLFSAACPGQDGQHHINCQWPEYWQYIFNTQGFVCDDAVRWRIWNLESIEPWYRQNMFLAIRSTEKAGFEKRIESVVHPEMLKWLSIDQTDECKSELTRRIEDGAARAGWFSTTPAKALWRKLKSRVASRYSK